MAPIFRAGSVSSRAGIVASASGFQSARRPRPGEPIRCRLRWRRRRATRRSARPAAAQASSSAASQSAMRSASKFCHAPFLVCQPARICSAQRSAPSRLQLERLVIVQGRVDCGCQDFWRQLVLFDHAGPLRWCSSSARRSVRVRRPRRRAPARPGFGCATNRSRCCSRPVRSTGRRRASSAGKSSRLRSTAIPRNGHRLQSANASLSIEWLTRIRQVWSARELSARVEIAACSRPGRYRCRRRRRPLLAGCRPCRRYRGISGDVAGVGDLVGVPAAGEKL